ncbi:MAG: hypothetical protein ACK5LN_06140 [Propioniciclava sp.]
MNVPLAEAARGQVARRDAAQRVDADPAAATATQVGAGSSIENRAVAVPKEFRDDVVRMAHGREVGVHFKQIAADFGISESCLRGQAGDEDEP